MLDCEAAAVIAEELRYIRPNLAEADAVLANPEVNPDRLRSAMGELLQASEQIAMAAGVIENRGLEVFADWLHGNTEFLAAMPRENHHADVHSGQLLTGWLDALVEGLTASGGADRWQHLATEMKRPGWPEPADHELMEHVFTDLGTGANTASAQPAKRSKGVSASDPASEDGMVSLHWDEQLDPRLLDAFFEETPDLVSELAAILHAYSGGGGDTTRAKRLAHTIKGSSGLIGLTSVAELTHALEDALESVEGRPLDADQAELLSETADWLESAFEALPKGGSVSNDYRRLHDALQNWQALPAEPEEEEAPEPPAEGNMEEGEEPQAHAVSAMGTRQAFLRVPLLAVDELMRLVGEQTTTIGQIQGRLQKAQDKADDLYRQDNVVLQRLAEFDKLVTLQSLPASGGRSSAEFDPLELDRYHELHSIGNAFIETLTDSHRINESLRAELLELHNVLQMQERLGREFNTAVLTTRLEPANKLDQRLQRAVRESLRQTGKKARLEIQGSDLLLDTDILNTLVNPLVHMLRNAVDHGIESPELRRERGKAPEGVIRVTYAREGTRIKVSVSDDGGGIDDELLHRTARRRGIPVSDGPLDDKTTLRLILNAGFSTRMQANQLSGRGIGMDLVRQAVDDLRGSIDFHNIPSQGCRFTLHLPLTLVSVPVLLVRAGDRVSAIPSATVEQLLYVEPGSVRPEAKGWVFEYGDQTWPVLPLGRLLGHDDEWLLENHAGRPVLLAQGEDATYALLVEAALANREVVVKSLGTWLPNIKGISGACILSDGGIAPVLDLPRLMRGKEGLSAASSRARLQSTPRQDAGPAKVLVVDDSLSARQALTLAVSDAGLQALTAIDGLDAISLMETTPVDLVVTDLEMPRMNGFELLAHLRANQATRDLPVIVVTSRSTAKHREKAQLAGADLYVTKPFDPTALKDQIVRLLEMSP